MMLLSVGEMAPIFAAMPQTQCCDLLPLLGGALAKEVLVAMAQAPAEKVLRNLEQAVVVNIMQVMVRIDGRPAEVHCGSAFEGSAGAVEGSGAVERSGDWLTAAALCPVQH